MKRLYGATRRAPEAERCELCAVPLASRHDHLYEPVTRRLRCACLGCALIIPTAEATAYRRVPRRCERVPLDATRWLAGLGAPVAVAAVIVRDDGRVVVGYPGPAGMVEANVDPALLGALPPLVPEVEALVCASLAGAWLTGIDVVYELIAELRASWQGFTGGPAASAAIARVLERA